MIKVFGRNPTGKRLETVRKSKQYKDGAFQNIESTEVMGGEFSYTDLLWKTIRRPAYVTPGKPVPNVKTDLHKPLDSKPTITWFGHSSYLLQSNGFNTLVDPVFSGYASPFSFFARAFPGSDIYKVQDMPPIDLLLITHDHYDHLDYNAILGLKGNVKRIVTSLGVGEHLEYWGFDTSMITELDWWQGTEITNDIRITATPARHFSGRTITRAQTLWSSFVLEINGYRIFLGGDSGYGEHFKAIARQTRNFDLAILESGQYGAGWPLIHMRPEETVMAAQDLGAKILLPVHWAKFALSIHPWNEPPKRVTAEAASLGQPVAFPMIGEPYVIGQGVNNARWWDFE